MSGCRSTVSQADLLGERYWMKFDNNKTIVKTTCGACCSIFLLAAIIVFAVEKFLTMIQYKGVSVLTTESRLHFADSDAFDYAHGLNIAVGFTGYDGTTGWQLDPSYGELVVNSIEWGQNEDGSYYRNEYPLETRNCTDLELGLKVQHKSKFYPTHEFSKRFLDLYEDKLLCLKEDDLIISGSWGNGRARQLNF